MVKKNRHRAGRRKREALEQARLATLNQAYEQFENFIGRPVARVEPQPARHPPSPPGRAIPLVDLADEDTVPLDQVPELIRRAENAVNRQEIETIDLIDTDDETPAQEVHSVPAIQNYLEPLNPEAPYDNAVISQLFLTIEEYARDVFNARP